MVVSNIERTEKLNKDIKLIIKIICDVANDSLISIILYGSYGRGEGAFFKKGNDVFVYNDYDLLLVVKNRIQEAIIVHIKQTLLDSLEIKWIDISQYTVSNLKRLKPFILNFDLKYGSKVIWGNPDILDCVPAFSSTQISLKDAELLYFTRLYPFLGSLDAKAFLVGIEGEKSRFFRNQMAKAVLAIDDVLLIQNNSYHSSYVERVSRLGKIYPTKYELIKLSNWALKEKMTPCDTKMTASETHELFIQVLRLYLEEMRISLSKFYKRTIKNTDDLIKAKSFSLQELILQMKFFILAKTLKPYFKQEKIRMIQSYAVESFIAEEKDKTDIFYKCRTMIQSIAPNQNFEGMDWDKMRNLIVKMSR
jgi:predicted nucleotidyltransferase